MALPEAEEGLEARVRVQQRELFLLRLAIGLTRFDRGRVHAGMLA